jgi:hypothetical protein
MLFKSQAPNADAKKHALSLRSSSELHGYQITLGVSRSLLRRLRDATFYLLLAYLALMTLPLAFNSTSTGLDASWSFATNYLPNSVYKYGPDVIFTYGPLGFICWPENVNSNLSVALAVRLLVWALLIAELIISYRRRRFSTFSCLLVVLALIVAQPVLTFLFDYMLVATALLLIVRDHPEAQRFWSGTLPLSVLVSLVFLAKASGFLTVMPAFLLYFALAYWQERTKPSRASLLRLSCVMTAPFIAYLLYDPSLGGLWAYVTATANIVSGYNDAMSNYGLPPDDLSLGGFVTLLLGFAAYAAWRKWLRLDAIACVTMALFVALKHGIVSSGHEVFFYGFGLVLFAILLLKCRGAKAVNVVGGATFAALSVLSLVGMDPSWKALSLPRWSLSPHLDQIGKLLRWKETIAFVAAQTEANLRADVLPDSVLARIRGAPVVIFPWELAYAPANHLNLVPLYTLQSYSAYTSVLDRATADHLDRTPRDTRILLEWKGLDERHPLLDVPATWEAIYSGFKAELAESGLLLLRKRDRPVAFNFKPLTQTIGDVRRWQDVPDRQHAVSVGITFSPTLVGIGQRLVYKINPVYMEFETDRGLRRRFRVVPDVLRHPFVINCLPLSGADLKSLVFENVCQDKIRRFRLSGEGLDSYSSSVEVAFAEDPAALVQFAGESGPDSKGAAALPETTSSAPGSGASFGDEVALSQYSIRNNSGHTEVELHWKALRRPSANYVVFVHALDSKGGIAFQFDHELKNASDLATSSWREGDAVTDWFSPDPPRNCAPGVYPLRLGLYVAKPFRIVPLTQSTLPRPVDDDWKTRAVLITNLECKSR